MDNLFKWENLVFIVLIFVFVYLARWTFQIKLWLALKPDFSFGDGFAKELVEKDNKALSVSFAAYMFAVGLILWSSLTSLGPDSGENIGLVIFWQLMGVVFLEIARLVNDKVLLNTVDNNRELIKDPPNLAVAAAEAGSYVATGLTIMAAVSGTPGELGQDLWLSAMWFGLGQLMFVLFACLLNTRLFAGFDFYAEIRKGNVAAGILFGLNLVAIGNLISNSILKSDALATFFTWYALGGIVLIVCRFLVDIIIIPGATMNHEIQVDRNYGAAILVGGISVALTFVLNTFLPDTCNNVT